ncbi:DUF3472 domain-containing protein [Nonomuraea dietziae]|uniref:DUF3472 domain-containing protein n=1 Tax=Nonomuraea dietziae TaxID=65515 RepID=UPI003438737C
MAARDARRAGVTGVEPDATARSGTTSSPASHGSWCETFGGEGEGMSCRIWHTWTPGQTYRFHYRAEGGGWWGMTVTNTSTNAQFKLGSIRVGADTMSPGSVSWAEYYRWSDPRSSCATEPYSRARITAPVGSLRLLCGSS